MQITLTQFERIDNLYSQFTFRGEPNLDSRADVQEWHRKEWRLMDALIDVIGKEAFDKYESTEACASEIIVKCLTSASLVVDEEST